MQTINPDIDKHMSGNQIHQRCFLGSTHGGRDESGELDHGMSQ